MKVWGQHLKSETVKSKLTNSEAKRALALRFGVAVLAIAVMASLATFTFTKSATAAAAVGTPAPAAAALDDNSVGALLSLDRAMETLAARVTPAVVNVTVVSKSKETASDEGGGPDMQQF